MKPSPGSDGEYTDKEPETDTTTPAGKPAATDGDAAGEYTDSDTPTRPTPKTRSS